MARSLPLILLALPTAGCQAQLQGFGLDGSSTSRTTSSSLTGGGGFESESALTQRFCGVLEARLEPQARRLSEAKKERDPRKALAIHGQVYRDAMRVQLDIQKEFDAEFKRLGDQAFKAGTAGTKGVGYGTTNNGNYFQQSEVALSAVAGGTALMVASGIPFAKRDDNGIRASEVNFIGESACRSERRVELMAQIKTNVAKLTKPFDVTGWGREEAMPIKPGALVTAQGGLLSGGASPTIRLSGGRPVYKNCRLTNRLDRIDANGVVHYQEECQYAGGRELVVLVTVKNVLPLMSPEVGALKPADFLAVTARVVSAKTKETKKGDLTTTTHTVEIEPIVVTEVDRDRKALFVF